MPRTRRAVRAASLPIALIAAAALAGCGAAPEPGATSAAASDYCARMVTNSGGLQDRSFNQSSWEGLQRAEEELGIQADVLVSTSETDLAPNVEQAVGTGCGFVLTVGYELAEATSAAAAENPDVHFSSSTRPRPPTSRATSRRA
jgi:basic membrane protein A